MKHNVEIFEEDINLELYYQFKSLIVNTTKVTVECDALKADILGYILPDVTLQSQYGFRYPGEVLEHYKSRGLDDVRSKHALLLALTDCMEILDSQMFNSNQLADFIADMRSLVEGDVYILCALLRWDTNTESKMQMCNKITVAQKMSTAAVLYVAAMSSQYEGIWQTIEERMAYVFLLHELNVYENMGIVNWLLQKFAPEIASSKRSCSRILKIILKLQQHKLSQSSKEFEYMTNLGYTAQELAYLNIQLSGACDDNAEWCSQTVKQNIVVAGFSLFITADKVEHPVIFEICRIILNKYSRLSRSVRGKSTLADALAELTIGSMEMFKELLKLENVCNLAKGWFDVMVLDKKWDDLYSVIDKERYRAIFERCLYGDFEYATEYMSRYKEMTGVDYIQDALSSITVMVTDNIKLLVQSKYMNMYRMIDDHVRDNYPDTASKGYIRHFLYDWHDDMLEYLDYIMTNYGLDSLHKLAGNNKLICKFLDMDDVYHNKPTDIEVSEDGMAELFEWACDEICRISPDRLVSRIAEVILSSRADKLPQDYTSAICDKLLGLDEVHQETKLRLTKKYKSEEEYTRLQEKQKRAEAARERREKKAAIAKYKKELQKLADGNDFVEALLKAGSRGYYQTGFREAWVQVLTDNIEHIVFKDDQASRVCQVIGNFVGQGGLKMTFGAIKDIINKLEVVAA